MTSPMPSEPANARAPIASLISKSAKALRRLTPGTWQHRMLQGNLQALHLAVELMNEEAGAGREFERDELEAALAALASMIGRTEKAGAGFAPGTSQHSLQRNRLNALRVAEALAFAKLGRRDG